MKKTTAEWVRKAQADWAAANKLGRARPRLHDQICFLCQQAVEKFLKANLQEAAIHIPYTHDLADLLDLLLPHHPALSKFRNDMDRLTPYAVEYRYPVSTQSRPRLVLPCDSRQNAVTNCVAF